MTQSFFTAPPEGMPAPSTVVDRMIDSVGATLRIARGLRQNGRPIDITGLDRLIGILCARALDLPAEQGRSVRSQLAMLLTELDALGVALQPT